MSFGVISIEAAWAVSFGVISTEGAKRRSGDISLRRRKLSDSDTALPSNEIPRLRFALLGMTLVYRAVWRTELVQQGRSKLHVPHRSLCVTLKRLMGFLDGLDAGS